MKALMKLNLLLPGLFVVFHLSCKKEEVTTNPSEINVSYSSMDDFHKKNEIPLQKFTLNTGTGGVLTAIHGTKIFIPSNAFVKTGNIPVAGDVSIQFKEVYTKSDMIFSGMNTGNSNSPGLLVSGGMFFMRATQDGNELSLAQGKVITVKQPFSASEAPQDSGMLPFLLTIDPFVNALPFWLEADSSTSATLPATLQTDANDYIYSLYQFGSMILNSDTGTWGNSDNPNFFANFSRVPVTFHCTQLIDSFSTELFLLFKNQNCMVHIYKWNSYEFSYPYAPDGINCTAVAIGLKDGKLYSSFVPLTISNNLVLNITLIETNIADFKSRLNALN